LRVTVYLSPHGRRVVTAHLGVAAAAGPSANVLWICQLWVKEKNFNQLMSIKEEFGQSIFILFVISNTNLNGWKWEFIIAQSIR